MGFSSYSVPPLDRLGFYENTGMIGQPVIENPTQKGTVPTQPSPLPAPSAKSVGFMLQDKSVSQPGSGREMVGGMEDGIISGNMQPVRTQKGVATDIHDKVGSF